MSSASTRNSQKGVMLLEAMIGILIFSLGILGIIALQARAITSVSDATYRSQASFLVSDIIGQIWVDRGNMVNYSYPSGTAPALTAWLAKVNSELPGTGANPPQITVDPVTGMITVIVRWQPSNARTPHSQTAVAQITNP